MKTERKAFKVVYGLIVDNLLTEKEAYDLCEGIFEQKILQVPIPIPEITEEKDTTPTVPQIEVTGFKMQ